MRPWGGFLILMLLAHGASAMEVEFSGGGEYYQWQEFDALGNEILTESGPRNFLAFNTINRIDEVVHADFNGRFYSGKVDYDGQYSDGTPAQTDVDYSGMLFEVGFTFFEPGRRHGLDGLIGLNISAGAERWLRHLLGVGGYEESYHTSYARVGFNYLNDEHLRFDFGVRYPYAVKEEVSGYLDHTVTLYPEPKWSAYGSIDIAINSSWWLGLRYDGYRFAASEPVDGILQPESDMDTLGLSVQFHF